ncbi:Swt1 family HEPN domain-containing protein [Rhodococcus sp. MEB064]|uniref:Swt1 family HEPN domain-containing protein n=1 Tax=Rhodococcus sp. MEB064 TaxID=1587522 RepID=UPI0012E00D14|nr:Swt1 family HEPN domain-containing protein [Rhodococcus sp. MEB064]
MDEGLLRNLIETRPLLHFKLKHNLALHRPAPLINSKKLPNARRLYWDWSDSAFGSAAIHREEVFVSVRYDLEEDDDYEKVRDFSRARLAHLQKMQEKFAATYIETLWTIVSELANRWLIEAVGPDWAERLADRDAARPGRTASPRPRYNPSDPSCSLRALTDWHFNTMERNQLRNAYARELIEWRNSWAHRDGFDLFSAHRAIDTAYMLVGEIERYDIWRNDLHLELETIRGEVSYAVNYLTMLPVVVLGQISSVEKVPGSDFDGTIAPVWEYEIDISSPKSRKAIITLRNEASSPMKLREWVEVDVSHLDLETGIIGNIRKPYTPPVV